MLGELKLVARRASSAQQPVMTHRDLRHLKALTLTSASYASYASTSLALFTGAFRRCCTRTQ
eukprot:1176356-Prorocentrum_minimum.AAC.3